MLLQEFASVDRMLIVSRAEVLIDPTLSIVQTDKGNDAILVSCLSLSCHSHLMWLLDHRWWT